MFNVLGLIVTVVVLFGVLTDHSDELSRFKGNREGRPVISDDISEDEDCTYNEDVEIVIYENSSTF